MSRIGVIGAGAWGTAIAHTMAANGYDTTLWARSANTAAQINRDRQNRQYLGKIKLHSDLVATNEMSAALNDHDFIFLATPAQTTEAIANTMMHEGLSTAASIICCAKGLNQHTRKRVSETVADVLINNTIMALSGPSFAHDVASGLPTAVTLAGEQMEPTLAACRSLSSPTLRLYASDDLRGVELGGALKNVMAIAAGIVKGAGLGESAKAALIARGFVEIERLAQAYGAQPDTLKGLSGLGDLVLTCGSTQSRNYSFGLVLADKSIADTNKLAEGAYTAESARRLAHELKVEAPVIAAVADVLSGQQTVVQAVESLTSRPVKAELD
ncbi:MAG: NAD(P)H-dependent glycerol-3-phosphate dehydrogenase [Pseudomonadota bacterium]